MGRSNEEEPMDTEKTAIGAGESSPAHGGSADNPEPVCADCGSDLDNNGHCKAGCANTRIDWQEEAR